MTIYKQLLSTINVATITITLILLFGCSDQNKKELLELKQLNEKTNRELDRVRETLSSKENELEQTRRKLKELEDKILKSVENGSAAVSRFNILEAILKEDVKYSEYRSRYLDVSVEIASISNLQLLPDQKRAISETIGACKEILQTWEFAESRKNELKEQAEIDIERFKRDAVSMGAFSINARMEELQQKWTEQANAVRSEFLVRQTAAKLKFSAQLMILKLENARIEKLAKSSRG